MARSLALITGASSGIGRELARTFAEHDYDVVMTAEDAELDAAAADVRQAGTEVTAVRTDLATPEGVDRLIAGVDATGRQVDALALNAGVGNSGAFVDIPLTDEQRLLGLNIGSTVQLAKHYLPPMVERGDGKVLITSSVAATMPGPYYATYAASKAFMLSLAEALRYEVKDRGVTVTALMPGPTDTEFFDRAGMQDTPIYDAGKDDPKKVAEDGFEALMSGKDHVVAGSMKNRAQTAAGNVMTEPMKAGLHAKMTRPSSDDE
jgi:short-subunit dehydrogenase